MIDFRLDFNAMNSVLVFIASILWIVVGFRSLFNGVNIYISTVSKGKK